MDFAALAQLCAPNVHVDTMHRIVSVESNFNPYAIGVVGGKLERQPRTLDEAVATAKMLEVNGYNYSLGLAQVNKKNFPKYELTFLSAFDPCQNLRTGGAILEDCYKRAGASPTALTDAFSCYYSGSFTAGYSLGYVAKIQAATPPAVTDLPSQSSFTVPMMSARDRMARTSIRLQTARRSLPVRVPVPDTLFVSASLSPVAAVAPDTPLPQPVATHGPATALLF